MVSQHPSDLSLFYGDQYYHSEAQLDYGYQNYVATADNDVAWAACLIRLLVPSGRVLDIGCVDGHLLKKLLPSHDCYGIEVNAAMAALAVQAGIKLIASDIFDPAVLERYSGQFDLVSAVAVFEHVHDIRRAVEIALALLKPSGILLFEVPLISLENPSDIWFSSSLEHVYYPFQESLHYLFETIFRLPLIGCEVVATDYASVFIGIVPKDPQFDEELRARYHRLVSSPISALASSAEKELRFALDVLHAGQTTPDRLVLLLDIDFPAHPPAVYRRLVDLWRRDAEKLAVTASYLREVEAARDWHAERSKNLERTLAERNAKIPKVLRWIYRRLKTSLMSPDKPASPR